MLASSPSKTRRFLAVLDETVDVFCFQTFDDLKTRRDPRLARTLHGSLGQHYERLKRLNEEGAGVFIAVNAMKVGVARKIANLERVRAIWQDDDNGFHGKYPLFPSIVVRSSIGKAQRYWLTDRLKPDLHQSIMRRLMQDFGADPGAYDLVRVLRLPGFYHMKDPANPQPVELIEAPGWIYSVDQITAAFPPVWPSEPTKPKTFNRQAFDADEFGRLIEALSFIPSDDRGIWYRIGAALKHEFGDTSSARALWDGWSRTSTKFDVRTQERSWRSFKRCAGCISTLGTVYHLARSHGFGGCHNA